MEGIANGLRALSPDVHSGSYGPRRTHKLYTTKKQKYLHIYDFCCTFAGAKVKDYIPFIKNELIYMEELITSLQDLFIGLFAGMSGLAIGMIGLAMGLLALLIAFFIRFYIAYRMAVNRHRDPLGWVLLSFFVSPLMTWIILLIAGDDTNRN